MIIALSAGQVIPPEGALGILLWALFGIVVLGILSAVVGNYLNYKIVKRYPWIDPEGDGIHESHSYQEWRERQSEYQRNSKRIP